ncbi:MAG TPA: glycosyltransferase family 2 protein [Caulobacteraceae bacterium]|jgi:dolichol-phosphate mannosyltransferase|nr:glycosyltransferase family 2 protein [Caulobacteraceae bacterium]
MIQSPLPKIAPRLSVIAPCFDEEPSLPAFVQRMTAACDAAVGEDYELVLVNDGSRDRTWSVIQDLTAKHSHIVGVNLSRNHGHQLAVTAGLHLARGELVMIIDADLQDPPELLPEMMSLIGQGFDVVYGRRRTRASESRFKRATASLFYRLLDKVADVEIPRDTGDFRLMTRRIVDRLNAMPEHDRFIRGMVAWLGGRQTEILYDRDARHAGETHYTLGKMLKLAANGLTSFSTAPLRIASFLAVVGMLIAGAIMLYALVSFFQGNVARGWTSQALITVFFGIGQFGCLAIIGAYLGRIYMQVKGRPLYLIDEVVASPPTGAEQP